MDHPVFGKHITKRELIYGQIRAALLSRPMTMRDIAAELEILPVSLRAYLDAAVVKNLIQLADAETAKHWRRYECGPVPRVYRLSKADLGDLDEAEYLRGEFVDMKPVA